MSRVVITEDRELDNERAKPRIGEGKWEWQYLAAGVVVGPVGGLTVDSGVRAGIDNVVVRLVWSPLLRAIFIFDSNFFPALLTRSSRPS